MIYCINVYKYKNSKRRWDPETWFVKHCETKVSEMNFQNRALT
jgi:hypothetical protein